MDRLRLRLEGHRRRRQRRGDPGARYGRPRAPRPDRLRAQLRLGRSRRRGPALRFRGVQDCLMDFPVLTALVVLPAIGAALVLATPRTRPALVRVIGCTTSFAVLVVAGYTLYQFGTGTAAFQFVSQHVWIKEWGISWHLGIAGISLFLVVLTAVLFPFALAGADPHHDVKAYTAWMLVLEAGCLGVFLALDLFLFFVFWEIVLVPMYFLIGGWGYERRVYAALKFFIYTMTGSALMLVGILALVFIHASHTHQLTFDLQTLARQQSFSESTARWLFAAFAISFAIKVPIFPLHTWLPDAHTEAPTAGSVILAGVLLKLGTYGFLRFGLYLFPKVSHDLAPLLLTLGVIGIIDGAIVAAAQRDLKRLIAYSSVAHLGFIILGTFALTTQGVQGGLLQMINHGLSTGALFLLVGMIYERRHTRQIADFGGLQKVAPIFAGGFMLVMLSSVGVPGLNGFVGEFLVLIGTFISRRWRAVVAATR